MTTILPPFCKLNVPEYDSAYGWSVRGIGGTGIPVAFLSNFDTIQLHSVDDLQQNEVISGFYFQSRDAAVWQSKEYYRIYMVDYPYIFEEKSTTEVVLESQVMEF